MKQLDSNGRANRIKLIKFSDTNSLPVKIENQYKKDLTTQCDKRWNPSEKMRRQH